MYTIKISDSIKRVEQFIKNNKHTFLDKIKNTNVLTKEEDYNSIMEIFEEYNKALLISLDYTLMQDKLES